jgi:hypothetical protein
MNILLCSNFVMTNVSIFGEVVAKYMQQAIFWIRLCEQSIKSAAYIMLLQKKCYKPSV